MSKQGIIEEPPQTKETEQVGQHRLVRRFNWAIANERTGGCCNYSAAHGKPVTKDHVETSPKVLEWAGGDPIRVFQTNAKRLAHADEKLTDQKEAP